MGDICMRQGHITSLTGSVSMFSALAVSVINAFLFIDIKVIKRLIQEIMTQVFHGFCTSVIITIIYVYFYVL